MEGRKRALTALDFEEPDRVPIWESSIDPPHLEAITGKSGMIDGEKTLQYTMNLQLACYRKLGFDLVLAGVTAPKGWKPQVFPDGTFTDEWGRIYKRDYSTRTSIPVGSTIESIEDWESYPFPDPNGPGRTDAFKYIVKSVEKGEMLVVGSTRTPFATAWEVFTPTIFCQLLFEKPQAMARVIERITDFNIEITKLLIEAGAELIFSSGDIAEKNGPMISPSYFEGIIYPNMRRETNMGHKLGVKFIKHTDGYVTPLLDGLIKEAGIDGIHSLDPSARVSIGEIKQKYGDQLILMGNVSVDNLAMKGKKEIIRETKECIRLAAPGGGFILNSSNSWYADCRFENCLAMVETGRGHGRYPMKPQRSE